MSAAARRLCGVALFAGLLTASANPVLAQALSYVVPDGSPFPQYAPQTQPGDVAPNGDELSAPLRRQVVAYQTNEAPGTIIIDTPHTFLYLTLGSGKALRYGIGVGRQGFTWSGTETITRKAEWPDWIPPAEMVARQPYLPRWVGGGPGNPLGARALYLGNTDYRIHGTNDPTTIGKRVSSGCIRLQNSDVEDLYDRVGIGTKVIVLPAAQQAVSIDRDSHGRMTAQIDVRSVGDEAPSVIQASRTALSGIY